MHARSVGIEDAGDLDRQFVLSPIVEEQGFGAAFSFIIAGTGSNRIDASPISLGLRMDFRIAIDFGGRCLENRGSHTFGESKHIDGAVHACLRRLHRIPLIVNGGGGACKIEDLVDFDIERECDVMPNQLEVRLFE